MKERRENLSHMWQGWASASSMQSKDGFEKERLEMMVIARSQEGGLVLLNKDDGSIVLFWSGSKM